MTDLHTEQLAVDDPMSPDFYGVVKSGMLQAKTAKPAEEPSGQLLPPVVQALTAAGLRPEIRTARWANIVLLLVSEAMAFAMGAFQHGYGVASAIVFAMTAVLLLNAVNKKTPALFQGPPPSSLGYLFSMHCLLWLALFAMLVLLTSLLLLWVGPYELAHVMKETSQNSQEQRLLLSQPSFFTFLNIAVLVPIYEELLFRGYLLGAYRKLGDGFAIVMSSFMFLLGHRVGVNALHAFGIGLIFALLVVRYNSILPGILGHMLNNFLAVFMSMREGDESSAADNYLVRLFNEEPLALPMLVLVSSLLLLAAVYVFYRLGRRLRRLSAPDAPLLITINEAARVMFHWPVLLAVSFFLMRILSYLLQILS